MLALIYQLNALMSSCIAAIADIRYQAGARNATANADAVALAARVVTLEALLRDLRTYAYQYKGSIQDMLQQDPGNISQYYILTNENNNVSQVWWWVYGQTTADNGVTVFANQANNGRFFLLGAT